MACSARMACCSGVLIATKRISGCCAAVQIAWASAASFLLVLTNGRTNCAAISLTSWPSFVSSRAQCWAVPHDSITTSVAGNCAKYSSTSARLSCRRTTSPVSWSTACTWNTRFAISSPIVVRFIRGSFPVSGGSELPLWHVDAVGFRSLPSSANRFLAIGDLSGSHPGGVRPFHLPDLQTSLPGSPRCYHPPHEARSPQARRARGRRADARRAQSGAAPPDGAGADQRRSARAEGARDAAPRPVRSAVPGLHEGDDGALPPRLRDRESLDTRDRRDRAVG